MQEQERIRLESKLKQEEEKKLRERYAAKYDTSHIDSHEQSKQAEISSKQPAQTPKVYNAHKVILPTGIQTEGSRQRLTTI